jgi:hypothetical protein
MSHRRPGRWQCDFAPSASASLPPFFPPSPRPTGRLPTDLRLGVQGEVIWPGRSREFNGRRVRATQPRQPAVMYCSCGMRDLARPDGDEGTIFHFSRRVAGARVGGTRGKIRCGATIEGESCCIGQSPINMSMSRCAMLCGQASLRWWMPPYWHDGRPVVRRPHRPRTGHALQAKRGLAPCVLMRKASRDIG